MKRRCNAGISGMSSAIHILFCPERGTTSSMAILELVRTKPDWSGALAVAMTRPPGVPERRAGEDPWNPSPNFARPRRISDDLAWFRRAVDEPSEHGLQPLDG